MRILFDSKNKQFKDPFGTLVPGQNCKLHIHVPANVGAQKVECVIRMDGTFDERSIPMTPTETVGAYVVFSGQFSLDTTGLYFYYFRIHKPDSCFRLFKQGDDTNMEDGSQWQVSCVPADFTTPDWAKGATIYQVFPDRFYKYGHCDLTGKLEPYTIHRHWDEEVVWKPDAKGEVLNNDFYGGNFKGIAKKMGYIASMGATILYLNPISKSFSSHRYDTGDYKTPDPMLGTEEDFVAMCEEAHKHGIKVILDGVYSHTGSNSLYFDREGIFGGNGAYCSQESPYYSWYQFYNYPNSYNSWWGFYTLPTVNKMDPAFLDYIIDAEDSVVAHWLKLGADGFRLDVADELPDAFILRLKKRIREIKPDALLMGEVWEDASNKIAYDARRRYFVDGELDSCMNYPFRTAIINFLRGNDGGHSFKDTIMTIVENYPQQVVQCNMNLLGTHDTPRILTWLVDDFEGSREEYAKRRISRNRLDLAYERLMMASFIQYMLPGSPSLYYGDEAGMEGHKDPFNRRTFPWGNEEPILMAHYRALGAIRQREETLRLGDIQFFHASDRRLGFTRSLKSQKLKIYVNRNSDPWEIPAGNVLLGHNLQSVAPDWLCLAPMGFCITESK